MSTFLLIGTVACQHPNPVFARLKRLDILSSLFPNWRFFAPDPAQHDYHVVYRTLADTDESSKWIEIDVITHRELGHIVWFPGRRLEKGLFDVVSELTVILRQGMDAAMRHPTYRLLCGFVEKEICKSSFSNVKGFQFGLIKSAGYDGSEPPEVLFVSRYIQLTNAQLASKRS